MNAKVISVAARAGHGLGKDLHVAITLITGEGVLDDAHRGVTVKHRSRVAKNPDQPNLRQIHLIHAELLDDLLLQGFRVLPGELGENILTSGMDLLGLPVGALLNVGSTAVLQLTGLRNPCHQINEHTPKLMDAMLGRAADGSLIRKAGVMAIVITGGVAAAGDPIAITLPYGPQIALGPV